MKYVYYLIKTLKELLGSTCKPSAIVVQ